jgi:hypothetical protein
MPEPDVLQNIWNDYEIDALIEDLIKRKGAGVFSGDGDSAEARQKPYCAKKNVSRVTCGICSGGFYGRRNQRLMRRLMNFPCLNVLEFDFYEAFINGLPSGFTCASMDDPRCLGKPPTMVAF